MLFNATQYLPQVIKKIQEFFLSFNKVEWHFPADKKDCVVSDPHFAGCVYNGNWEDGPNGEGKMKYLDGSVYEGNWKDGKRDGFGRMTYPNGCVYEGWWRDDKRHNNATSHNITEHLNDDISPSAKPQSSYGFFCDWLLFEKCLNSK